VAHILVIDDDKLLGSALVQFLTQDRHQVTVSNSKTDRMLCGAQDKIDLIVTGILVECEHALEAVAALAKASGCIPVIALAGVSRKFSEVLILKTHAEILVKGVANSDADKHVGMVATGR